MMSLSYNLSQAAQINASADGYILQGLIRHAHRYPVGLEGIDQIRSE